MQMLPCKFNSTDNLISFYQNLNMSFLCSCNISSYCARSSYRAHSNICFSKPMNNDSSNLLEFLKQLLYFCDQNFKENSDKKRDYPTFSEHDAIDYTKRNYIICGHFYVDKHQDQLLLIPYFKFINKIDSKQIFGMSLKRFYT